jgi:predicted DCC family thiol-disulfide oxidoreductase YuxK
MPTVETSGRAAPGRLAVLYDADCMLCREMLQAVRQFDNSGEIDALDLHDESVRASFPGLEREQLMRELHAVDDRGRIFRGARAVNEILRRQSGFAGLFAYLWYVPGYAWLAEWQYRRIAAARNRLEPKRQAQPSGTDSD